MQTEQRNMEMEVFGSPGQQEVERRAAHAWTLLRDDPRFTSHGRAVGLARAGPHDVALQIALARLQGVGPAEGVRQAEVSARRAVLSNAGLVVDEYVKWSGGAGACPSSEFSGEPRRFDNGGSGSASVQV